LEKKKKVGINTREEKKNCSFITSHAICIFVIMIWLYTTPFGKTQSSQEMSIVPKAQLKHA